MSKTEKYQLATFAGGCFWCMVKPFDEQPGIINVVSGYTGGITPNPSYEQVCSEKTGHYEAVQITFDPKLFSYARLLDIFWQQIDPTDSGGQFCDRGPSYKAAIFFHNAEQQRLAEASKAALAQSGRFDKPITTEILPAKAFYLAEEYHQDFYKKDPVHYRRYRRGSGRNQFQADHWDLKQRLTPIQYEVTQNDGTEPPFKNEYWDNTREGIYVDVVSGEPLFSSKDKFDAGCGWPSFSKPLSAENIDQRQDKRLGMERTEVRSRNGNSHLGHVFSDGPEPTGLRYCINSAALRFIPKEELETAGYGGYKFLFD